MRYGFNAYGRAWLPFWTRRLVRAIRRNPFAALLVEGFLLFAMVSLLSTPMAWATDGIEEWNDPGVAAEDGTLGEVRVEYTGDSDGQSWFAEGMKKGAEDAGITEQEARENQEKAVEESRKKNEEEFLGKKSDDTNKNDTATNTQTNNGMGNGLTSTSGAALDSSMLNARTAISRVNLVVTGLLLPVGIVWASWQIVYIALVCGLLGIDPLDLISAEDEKTPWLAIKRRLVNFATGLALVGGIWLIFELVLFLVANFVGALETNL